MIPLSVIPVIVCDSSHRRVWGIGNEDSEAGSVECFEGNCANGTNRPDMEIYIILKLGVAPENVEGNQYLVQFATMRPRC